MSSKCIFRYEPTNDVKYHNAHQAKVCEDLGYSHVEEPHPKTELTFCRACTFALEKGDWIFSKPSSSGNVKRYHLRCAVRLLIVDKSTVKAKKYQNLFYVVALGVWATEIYRHLSINLI